MGPFSSLELFWSARGQAASVNPFRVNELDGSGESESVRVVGRVAP